MAELDVPKSMPRQVRGLENGVLRVMGVPIVGIRRSACALRDNHALMSTPPTNEAPASPVHPATAALAAFDLAVASQTAFRPRAGQRTMAQRVAQTFGDITLGKVDEGAPVTRSIAVIQAGTGVGKSLAYCAPAIAIALARKTRVLISTATVALQEQLVHKDLPALAQALPTPFRFALAKGRGRYVCKLKLARLSGDDPGDGSPADELFGDDEAEAETPARDPQQRVALYRHMMQDLALGRWDGDRDSLNTPPEPADWAPVAAEASSCTNKHCPVFSSCSYFEKRKELVGAQVIVANHDLLLSSLGNRLLPELDHCLLVLDEGHHLPAVALDQFAHSMHLTRLGWIDKLATRARKVGGLLNVSEVADLPRLSAQLRQGLQDMARLVQDLYANTWNDGINGVSRARVPRGGLPPELVEPLHLVLATVQATMDAVSAVAKALRTEMRDKPDEARRLSTLYAQVGVLAPRLEGVQATTLLLLTEAQDGADSVPVAKWFTRSTSDGWVHLAAHASPMLPGATLAARLWSGVRGAVVTSATLTSCGNFDFFLRETGLNDDPDVGTLDVPSPFDYARQGRFVAASTHADPRHAQDYTREMVSQLLRDLQDVRSGALVLFTSRDQMRQAVAALDTTTRSWVLVQGDLPRPVLLARHRQTVAAGQRSVIFGMQSFGEGLDLPGSLCESVFIAKLPFAPPDDPVGEARAEWLRAMGRDPFNELVVPATAVRLAQWAGRAIRTETDEAHIYCYDKRLSNTGYGRRLLQGLPPFTRIVRAPDPA